MKKMILALTSLPFSAAVGYFLTYSLMIPTLESYQRIAKVIHRFPLTDDILFFFITASLCLFLIQFIYRKFSAIYLYLFYSVYLLLMFIVLFTKAPRYHAYSFDLFDFMKGDKKDWIEALLNIVYFVPLGGLYGMKAKWWEFILIALSTIFAIESIQYFYYLGTFAVSDIFLNMLGCSVGYLFLTKLLRPYLTKGEALPER